MFDMAEIKKQLADVKDSVGDNMKQNFPCTSASS